jgi:hypothetical protein
MRVAEKLDWKGLSVIKVERTELNLTLMTLKYYFF